MRIFKITSAGIGTLVFVLAVYWTWRVSEARGVTPGLVAEILEQSDPEIQNLSAERISMLIALEDPSFWNNDGTDFSTPGQGLTTLTQGLGKRIYFERFTPGFKKIELVLMSRYALNTKASKDDILEAFMNVAYLGDDDAGSVIGLGEGARRWYGRKLSELSDDEYLGLIAMLVAPNALDPVRYKTENTERVGRIKRWRAGDCEPEGLNDVLLDGCAILKVNNGGKS